MRRLSQLEIACRAFVRGSGSRSFLRWSDCLPPMRKHVVRATRLEIRPAGIRMGTPSAALVMGLGTRLGATTTGIPSGGPLTPSEIRPIATTAVTSRVAAGIPSETRLGARTTAMSFAVPPTHSVTRHTAMETAIWSAVPEIRSVTQPAGKRASCRSSRIEGRRGSECAGAPRVRAEARERAASQVARRGRSGASPWAP